MIVSLTVIAADAERKYRSECVDLKTLQNALGRRGAELRILVTSISHNSAKSVVLTPSHYEVVCPRHRGKRRPGPGSGKGKTGRPATPANRRNSARAISSRPSPCGFSARK